MTDCTVIVPLPLSKKFHTTSQFYGFGVLQFFAIISKNFDFEISLVKSSNCSEFQNSYGVVNVHCNDLPINMSTRWTSLKWVREKFIAPKISMLPSWLISIALKTILMSSELNSVKSLPKHFLNWWIDTLDFIGKLTIWSAISWNCMFFSLSSLSRGF